MSPLVTLLMVITTTTTTKLQHDTAAKNMQLQMWKKQLQQCTTFHTQKKLFSLVWRQTNRSKGGRRENLNLLLARGGKTRCHSSNVGQHIPPRPWCETGCNRTVNGFCRGFFIRKRKNSNFCIPLRAKTWPWTHLPRFHFNLCISLSLSLYFSYVLLLPLFIWSFYESIQREGAKYR